MKLANICILLVVALSCIVHAAQNCPQCFNTSAYVTITNKKGISVNQAYIGCNFTGYSVMASDEPLRCHDGHQYMVGDPVGPNGEVAAGNMSNWTCNYTFYKNYTVEGDWNATIQFEHNYDLYGQWGFNPYTPYINYSVPPTYDDDTSYGTYLWSGDCMGPGDPSSRSYCYVDQTPACRSGRNSGSLETVSLTLYTINYDQNPSDCAGNNSKWFNALNSSMVPAQCAGNPNQACCCGDDGADDNFFYYNSTGNTCSYCYKGTNHTQVLGDKKCDEAYCTYQGWNNTVCANATAWSQPPSDTSDSYCYGEDVKFICNYTDGDGNPIGIDVSGQTATVYIYIDGIPHSNSGIGDYGADVRYNYTGIYYYNETSDLGENMLHVWYCNASKSTYRTAWTSPPSKINITPNSPTVLEIRVNNSAPALGEKINITANYTNASISIADADCELAINSDLVNLRKADYDPVTRLYSVTTNELMPGPNDLDYTCKKPCFKTATAHATVYVSWTGELNFPAITIEDPTYSINSGGIYHKIIKRAPPELYGNLTKDLGFGNFGFNWTYGMVIKPSKLTPACADINALVDPSKILLVSNSSLIANVSSCPNIANFSGIIFQDDACIINADYCKNALEVHSPPVPYLLNFTINATFPTPIYNVLPNLTYVLLNGEKHVVQDISNMRLFYFNGYYVESTQAPSFLMRLNGQLGPSPYGIYSFIDARQFSLNRSSVDYYYFNNTNQVKYQIKGMPNCENVSICRNDSIGHFQLDNEIAAFNSSGGYTHITSMAVEKLTLNPLGVDCVTDSECGNNITNCGPGVPWCSAGYSCQWLPPIALCTNRYCQNGKCTSCNAAANCPAAPTCGTPCYPSKYCNTTTGTCVSCSTNFMSCISPYTSCINVMDADSLHCGSCNPCAGGAPCINGVCQPICIVDGSCNITGGESVSNCPADCCSNGCTARTTPTGGSDGLCHSQCAGRLGCGASPVADCNYAPIGSSICGFRNYISCCYGTVLETCTSPQICCDCLGGCASAFMCRQCEYEER